MIHDGPFKNHPPDGLERGIRFGCGGLFGACFAVYLCVRSLRVNWSPDFWLFILIFAVAFGCLSMVFGDRFWLFMTRWRR